MSSASARWGSPQSFGCLWLTDLHCGQYSQKWLWPSLREEFFDDLARLHRLSGPWDVVIFTGDLVYSGAPEEFITLTPILQRIWEVLRSRQDVVPVLLTTVGNHDLRRPDKKAAATAACGLVGR